jgi:ABC-2 type transport system permease protein/sodium transport system permease protein
LFHVISPLGLLWERLLPSLLLGLLLGWLAYRSESVWPGMVLHMLNNVVLLSLARYKSQLILWGWLPEDAEHWPWPWLAASAVGTMVGICIIVCARKPSPHARPSP